MLYLARPPIFVPEETNCTLTVRALLIIPTLGLCHNNHVVVKETKYKHYPESLTVHSSAQYWQTTLKVDELGLTTIQLCWVV